MNQATIQKKYPKVSPLEAKAMFLSEVLENQTTLGAYVKEFEKARTGEDKADILDMLGSTGGIEEANATVANSSKHVSGNTSEEELSQMLTDWYLSKSTWGKLVKA